MINAIRKYLEDNGCSVSNIVNYGDATSSPPSVPYLVIKGEKSPTGGRSIRFILHENVGKQDELIDELREVCRMVSNRQFTTHSGAINRLGSLVDYTDVTPVSDDGTISMEALFLMPTTTF